MNNIDFEKGLIPAIIQDSATLQVLMLGYMNREAYEKTLAEKRVTFFSRSKNRLWTKGETSGHFLLLQDIKVDCDNDTILIKAIPQGATCHTGAYSCFGEQETKGFIYGLERTIAERITSEDDKSYTRSLWQKGINKIAQKVGEEAVEVVIEAKDNNDELFKNEAADLLFHYLILLKAKGFSLTDIETVLKARSK